MKVILTSSCVAICVAIAGLPSEATAQVIIEWVTVGNAGNAPDPLAGGTAGAVSYPFQIGKYEVTNAQYAAFLNRAARTDSKGLYNSNMGSNDRGGIIRSGSSGSYTYTVKPNMGNKPVNYVSFYDAARFCNWMTNGQPAGGAGTESGVYTLVAVQSISETTRNLSNPNQVFMPTKEEWHKAAYHQPAAQGGDTDDYWLYATMSNLAPTIATATATGDVANPDANVANYLRGADWNSLDGNVTTVGSAGNSSFYGAFDMNGNLWEWNEEQSGFLGTDRGYRGGAYSTEESTLRSTSPTSATGSGEGPTSGFRVARPIQPCPGDWDDSGGQPNSSDFLAYLNDFAMQDPAADLSPPAGNGIFDSTDFLTFLNLYAQGC